VNIILGAIVPFVGSILVLVVTLLELDTNIIVRP
jgi:hypothetical protein